MRLRELSGVDSDSEVTGFAIDHRKVAPGSVFGAFKGAVFNGEDFIGQAVSRGAVAVGPATAPSRRQPLTIRPSTAGATGELAAMYSIAMSSSASPGWSTSVPPVSTV